MLGRLMSRELASWLIRILVSTGIVVYILVDVNRRHLIDRLSSVDLPLVGVAFLGYLGGQALSAYKWSLLGRSVGFEKPYTSYARFYFIGMFFNCIGVSTISGDVARALYLSGGRRTILAVGSVLFDRVSGLALLMALGAAALLVFPQYDLPWPLAASIVGGGTVLVLGWWICPWLVRLLPKTSRMRRQFDSELAPFWRDRRLLARVAVVSLLFHVTQVAVQWVLARAAGAAVPFGYAMFYKAVISVMTALPVSVAGLGVREGGYLYFLGRIDVDDSIAVTVGLLWFAVALLAGLVGGALFVVGGAHLPRPRAEAASDAAA
jgi:glycosyltransferase 2 family protein